MLMEVTGSFKAKSDVLQSCDGEFSLEKQKDQEKNMKSWKENRYNTEAYEYDSIPDSWASWLTLDDGRTVEEVRNANERREVIYHENTPLNTLDNNQTSLAQQMNLFMKIDTASPSKVSPPYRTRSDLSRGDSSCSVSPARRLTRESHLQRHSIASDGSAYCSEVIKLTSANRMGSTSSLSRVSIRGKTSVKGTSVIASSASKLTAKSREERYSFGDKLKIALGVKQSAPENLIGEKTAKLLQAVDNLKKSPSR